MRIIETVVEYGGKEYVKRGKRWYVRLVSQLNEQVVSGWKSEILGSEYENLRRRYQLSQVVDYSIGEGEDQQEETSDFSEDNGDI